MHKAYGYSLTVCYRASRNATAGKGFSVKLSLQQNRNIPANNIDPHQFVYDRNI